MTHNPFPSNWLENQLGISRSSTQQKSISVRFLKAQTRSKCVHVHYGDEIYQRELTNWKSGFESMYKHLQWFACFCTSKLILLCLRRCTMLKLSNLDVVLCTVDIIHNLFHIFYVFGWGHTSPRCCNREGMWIKRTVRGSPNMLMYLSIVCGL